MFLNCKVYESSGRLAEELIYTGSGHVHHESGLFDRCLVAIQASDDLEFQGQFCSVFFELKPTSSIEHYTAEPYKNMSNFRMPSVGFCLPSTCSAKDLRSAVAQLLDNRNSRGANYSIVTLGSEDYCYTRQKIESHSIKSDYGAIATLYQIFYY